MPSLDAVEVIGRRAFSGCRALRSVEFPSLLRALGDEAFLSCPDISNVVFPEEIDEVGHGVFRGCPKLDRSGVPERIAARLFPDGEGPCESSDR